MATVGVDPAKPGTDKTVRVFVLDLTDGMTAEQLAKREQLRDWMNRRVEETIRRLILPPGVI